MPVGALATNCYIATRGEHGLLVDPGDEGDAIWEYLQRSGSGLDMIINTHGHWDHVGAVGYMKKKSEAPVYMHGSDIPLVKSADLHDCLPDHELEGVDELDWAGLKVKVIPTPGHSQGSVSLIIGQYLLTGDTLFAGSVGRTDLPGGSMADLRNSLQILSRLDDELVVLPGHGPRTTLPEERRQNPFLAGL